MTGNRTTRTRLAAALLVAAVLLTGCAGSAEPAATSGVVLTVTDFHANGYGELLDKYAAAHPGVTIVEKTAGYPQHRADVLRGGTSIGDLAVVDRALMAELDARSADFAALPGAEPAGAVGAGWALAVGTGGLGMCYERSLLREAGLPSDRAAVAALWPTWDEYLKVGQQFNAVDLPAQWVDSAVSVYNAVLGQQAGRYYRADGTLSVVDNPAVLKAWQTAAVVVAVGESAQLGQLTPQWTAAIQSRRFATLPCPSWMPGWLEQNVPDIRGEWDMAPAPGGAGDPAGEYLVVPKAGPHAAAAAELAAWLAAPAQQVEAFRRTGVLPAAPAVRHGTRVRDYKDPFLNDAPVGLIYPASVAGRTAPVVGPRSAAVQALVERSLKRVDGWELSAADGWTEVTTAVAALPVD